jgi:methyltransferase-like protein/SAM-dependent methyltransferase
MSRASYEAIPYPPAPFVESHPSTMATLATVLGLDPPVIETARVLELGCATGGNIVPMAAALPRATFVGIDYSARQINLAREFAAGVSATNLRLEVRSILDIDRAFGTFDYIIAHGVFSWVPPNVQEKVLEICRLNLADRGVAYVSFNAYPGWHVLEWLRRAMLLHAPYVAGEDPQQRLLRAREMLDAILDAPRMKDSPMAALLGGIMRGYDAASEAHLLHDHLEEHNLPIYFEEFVVRARAHGLQYLADAQNNGSFVEEASSAKVKRLLDSLGADWLRREQYLDFIRNTTFRRALLVHAERKIDAAGMAQRIARLFATSMLVPDRPSDVSAEGAIVRFRDPIGAVRMSAGSALTKAALTMLAAEFPGAKRLAELLDEAASQLRLPSNYLPTAKQRTLNELIAAWMSRAIQFYATPPRAAPAPPDRPEVWRVARYQASRGETLLTNLRHDVVKLDAANQSAAAKILPFLDGTRTTDQILDAMASADPSQSRDAHEAALRAMLTTLARHALLMAYAGA